MANEPETTLQTIVAEILNRMGFVATVQVTSNEATPTSLYCSIKVEEGQNLLIGQYGVNLAALQHVVRVLARRQTGETMEIAVDINDYFAEKRALLEKEAEKAMGEALQNNISVALRPMLPYERKIIHAFLATKPSVTTESVGQGEARKVMIRPHPKSEE